MASCAPSTASRESFSVAPCLRVSVRNMKERTRRCPGAAGVPMNGRRDRFVHFKRQGWHDIAFSPSLAKAANHLRSRTGRFWPRAPAPHQPRFSAESALAAGCRPPAAVTPRLVLKPGASPTSAVATKKRTSVLTFNARPPQKVGTTFGQFGRAGGGVEAGRRRADRAGWLELDRAVRRSGF